MICNQENLAQLHAYLEPYGINIPDDQAELLLKHVDLVVEKNKVVNLTRITSDDDALVKQIVDSLLLLPSIHKHSDGEDPRLLDIGTGAGFPGIPLGIVLGCSGTLIDSVGKKVAAVEEFLTQLGLSGKIEAKKVRAEELAKSVGASFDVVTARAVADLGILLEYASPLLKKSGILVVSKGILSEEELKRGNDTASIVGMKLVSRETFELPNDAGHREILTYKKIAKSRIKLPRQTGMAKHHPLVS